MNHEKPCITKMSMNVSLFLKHAFCIQDNSMYCNKFIISHQALKSIQYVLRGTHVHELSHFMPNVRWWKMSNQCVRMRWCSEKLCLCTEIKHFFYVSLDVYDFYDHAIGLTKSTSFQYLYADHFQLDCRYGFSPPVNQ